MKKLLLISILFFTACFEESLESKCKKNDNEACFQQYKNYYYDKQYDKEMQMLEIACNNNHLKSCHNIGVYAYNDNVYPRDFLRAIKHFQKSCDLGDVNDCKFIAKLHYDFIKLNKNNFNIALKYSIKLCDLNEYEYCLMAAKLNYSTNKDKANIYAQKACDAKLQEACKMLETIK